MAAHIVTCRFCKERFDTNKLDDNEWIEYKQKCYAHKDCYEDFLKSKNKITEQIKKNQAKRVVKCPLCGENFDINSIPSQPVMGETRWAHLTCWNKATQQQRDELEYEKKTMDLINEIYGSKANWKLIKTQLQELQLQPKYTWSSIYKTLYYFYIIKKNSIDNSNGGIGIIEYAYQPAYDYYYSLWLAQERNRNIKITKPKEIIINIIEPQLQPKKRKLFTFLDEEVEDGK